MINKKRKRRFGMKTLLLLFVSVIGVYGILMAPEKDAHGGRRLEAELKRNQAYLQEQNSQEAPSFNDPEDGTKEGSHYVTIIGDSVALGAGPAMSCIIPNCTVDAAESRQAGAALEILQNLETQGMLGDIVVLSLGTNGYFPESTGQEIVDALGDSRSIYWVNVYGKYLQSHYATNEVIASLAQQNTNVSLIDWNQEGPQHPEWFYEDGIHLNENGQQGFAEFILDHLNLSADQFQD